MIMHVLKVPSKIIFIVVVRIEALTDIERLLTLYSNAKCDNVREHQR